MSVRPSDPKQNASLDVTEPRVRLAFLDGLRGLAALYVVLFHLVYQEAMRYGSALPQPWQVALAGLGRGRYAVAVFIVISGYCLMLPVARTVQGYLPGGVGRFLQRRARRILPPYYAALAICLLLLVLTALYQGGGGTGKSRPVVEASNLLAHLFLVHDLRAEWAQAIDPPMWSVAVEWHIYLLFPTLLLPLWRRLGNAIAIAIALGLGLLPHYLLPPAENFDWARPWYLGLFTMGMAAAAVEFSPRSRLRDWRTRPLVGSLRLQAGALACVAIWGLPAGPGWRWVGDVLIGSAAALLIISCAREAVDPLPQGASPFIRLLESRGARTLGDFSYSLYLLHLPAWWVVQPLLRALPLSPQLAILARLLVGVPWVLAASYVFYVIVEKRCASTPLKTGPHP